MVHDPLNNLDVGLQPPDDEGRFVDEYDKNSMTFETDGEGKVIALLLDSASPFER